MAAHDHELHETLHGCTDDEKHLIRAMTFGWENPKEVQLAGLLNCNLCDREKAGGVTYPVGLGCWSSRCWDCVVELQHLASERVRELQKRIKNG